MKDNWLISLIIVFDISALSILTFIAVFSPHILDIRMSAFILGILSLTMFCLILKESLDEINDDDSDLDRYLDLEDIKNEINKDIRQWNRKSGQNIRKAVKRKPNR